MQNRGLQGVGAGWGRCGPAVGQGKKGKTCFTFVPLGSSCAPSGPPTLSVLVERVSRHGGLGSGRGEGTWEGSGVPAPRALLEQRGGGGEEVQGRGGGGPRGGSPPPPRPPAGMNHIRNCKNAPH